MSRPFMDPKKRKSKQILIRLTQSEHKKISAAAKRQEVSVSEYLRQYVPECAR